MKTYNRVEIGLHQLFLFKFWLALEVYRDGKHGQGRT